MNSPQGRLIKNTTLLLKQNPSIMLNIIGYINNLIIIKVELIQNMAKYKLKLLFDPGSGVCLWSDNEEANKKYGYAIDHKELPLAENTIRWLEYLIAWFDTSIDWSEPTKTSETWTKQEESKFHLAVNKGFQLLISELAVEKFIVRSEIKP
ncbi:MAG: hypothetical protein GY760_14100 [Deltaproteobacteria bacterium]|nr:hypothetical protein [Deltaproteobacteria bacterium]